MLAPELLLLDAWGCPTAPSPERPKGGRRCPGRAGGDGKTARAMPQTSQVGMPRTFRGVGVHGPGGRRDARPKVVGPKAPHVTSCPSGQGMKSSVRGYVKPGVSGVACDDVALSHGGGDGRWGAGASARGRVLPWICELVPVGDVDALRGTISPSPPRRGSPPEDKESPQLTLLPRPAPAVVPALFISCPQPEWSSAVSKGPCVPPVLPLLLRAATFFTRLIMFAVRWDKMLAPTRFSFLCWHPGTVLWG